MMGKFIEHGLQKVSLKKHSFAHTSGKIHVTAITENTAVKDK
jgi:hypothetical protein